MIADYARRWRKAHSRIQRGEFVTELQSVCPAMGVALAHVFAFNLAARLFSGGRITPGTRRAVWAQLASAAAVAFVVTVPFFFLALGPALDVSGFLLAALIGITAYVASREAGAGRIRSLVDGVIALAVATAVVSVKVGFTGH